jgi:hypothetical protein
MTDLNPEAVEVLEAVLRIKRLAARVAARHQQLPYPSPERKNPPKRVQSQSGK